MSAIKHSLQASAPACLLHMISRHAGQKAVGPALGPASVAEAHLQQRASALVVTPQHRCESMVLT